ncbi:MAG TPA: response regulator transcription factor [Actinomycetota bacterium]|jgi:DNA-binding response OmpR family regulator|nr:response regulator transcription factor [Actinomycetota bacterium]
MNVLLVEDEDRIASFVEKALQRRGFDVVRVGTGGEALGAVSASVDIVVLDLGLPDIDGLDVLRALRRSWASLPVVILSARGDIDDRVVGLDLGADDYVPKPFAIDELVARIRARLRPQPDRTSTKLNVGDLELDLIAHRARLTGKIVELTSREFALLEMLMRHAGRAVPRSDLLSNVWGLDFDPRSNLVDVYIRYLRRKVGDDRIQTVRGVGYRIVEPAHAQ